MKNNVSHVLVGNGGNKMRYNFTGGNVATGACPEISLKSQYAQDLLEDSELFKSGAVVLVRKIRTREDEEKQPSLASREAVTEESQVTTPDELLAYINKNYEKKFTDPGKALAFAAKEGIVFANLTMQ